jgi:ATP-dependent helicase HrpB
VNTAADLEKIDIKSIITSSLSYEQQQALNKLAPESIKVPSGSMIRLQYFADGRPPILAVRLQEMFGLADTPTIDGGRMPVLIHLLSPGFKAVQVTQDLRSFWNNAYFEVRKELRMRYPKHVWPEDPWNEPAIKGVKKKTQRSS